LTIKDCNHAIAVIQQQKQEREPLLRFHRQLCSNSGWLPLKTDGRTGAASGIRPLYGAKPMPIV
jgi:hypothetical protein